MLENITLRALLLLLSLSQLGSKTCKVFIATYVDCDEMSKDDRQVALLPVLFEEVIGYSIRQDEHVSTLPWQ